MARILCNVAGGGKSLKGNAETGDVLAGKTFSNKQSNALTGSMPNNGAWSASTSGNGSVTIPAGYHNGSGTVSGSASYNSGYNEGVSTTKGNVKAQSIQKDVTTSKKGVTTITLTAPGTLIGGGYDAVFCGQKTIFNLEKSTSGNTMTFKVTIGDTDNTKGWVRVYPVIWYFPN